MNSEYDIVKEDSVKVKIYRGKISKKLPVFYNPVMKLNRDMSILVINTYFDKFRCEKKVKDDSIKKEQIIENKILIALPLSGSGIRGLRFLNIDSISNNIKEIHLNDLNRVAYENMIGNLKLNSFDNLLNKKVFIHNLDANSFLNLKRWDYIELDPFGSPVFFLENGLMNIKNDGILSVTATDTAALCGTYPLKTKKRYFIDVKKTFWYDEVGLRNLISYVIREAAKFNIASVPLVSYSQDHYYKVFFQVSFSKSKVNYLLKQLKYVYWDEEQNLEITDYCQKGLLGPIYIGELNNKDFLSEIDTDLIKEQEVVSNLINLMREELNVVGYIELHKLAKYYGIKQIPKFSKIFDKIREMGFNVSKTHNSKYGIKTDMSKENIVKLLKELEIEC